MRFWPAAVLIMTMAPVPGVATGNAVADIARLYADAAFDQALALAARATADSTTPTADLQPLRRLKLLCEVALRHDVDAARTAEEMVRVEPLPSASEADLPPPVQKLLGEVRTKVVPALVRDRYQRGRARLEQKDYTNALEDFELVISLVDNGPLDSSSQATLADIRLLASGFLDLTRAKASAPAAEPTAAPRAAAMTPAARAPRITPPEAIVQDIPAFRWTRDPAGPSPAHAPEGVLEVTISIDGNVTAARMTRSIHPVYDARVTRAALQWKYRPALSDGVPIEAVKTVTIKVASGR